MATVGTVLPQLLNLLTSENYDYFEKSNTVVGHGENGDLSDGAVTPLHTTRTLVDGGQVSVHVTWETTTTRHLFTGSRHL